MKRAGGDFTRRGGALACWLAVVITLLLAGTGLVASCARHPAGLTDDSGLHGDQLGTDVQAIYPGTPDPSVDGGTAIFPAVMSIATMGGGCSGTLISPQVVLTASHCVYLYAQGCEQFNYTQGAEPGFISSDGEYVAFPPPGSASVMGPYNVSYNIDAIAWHPRSHQVDLGSCGGNPACGESNDGDANGANIGYGELGPFDIALMHLATPVQGVTPMPFVARLGPTDPTMGQYDLDPATWKGLVPAIVGMSDSAAAPNGGSRAWGLTTISATIVSDSKGVNLSCAANVLTPWSSALEITTISAGQPQQSCGIPGDSGGPLILKSPVPGASITPLGLSVPSPGIVTAVASQGGTRTLQCKAGVSSQYPVTFDFDNAASAASDPTSGPSKMGTFILSHLVDFDQDGIPDDQDNCPITWQGNGPASNCNLIAEQAQQYLGPNGVGAGDLCDPIPCPDAVFPSPVLQGPVAGSGRMISDTWDVVPIGSHPVGNGSQQDPTGKGHTVDQVGVTLPNQATDYRFCQKDLVNLVTCQGGEISDKYITMEQMFPYGPPSEGGNPWLPVHMQAIVNGMPGAMIGEQEPLSYPSTETLTRQWLYALDYAEWVANGWITPVDTCPVLAGCGTNLDGVFWQHAEISLGTFQDQVFDPAINATTGYRVDDFGNPDGTGLANRYINLAPDQPFYGALPVGVPSSCLPGPGCGTLFNWQWLSDPDPGIYPGWDGVPMENSFLLALAGGHYGILLHNGTGLQLDSLIGPNLTTLLGSTSVVWAGAVEPRLNTAVGGETAGAQAIAVSADGTTIVDQVIRSGLNIGTAADAVARGDALPPAGSIGTSEVPPRAAFTAVYTRSENAVFIVGGQDVSTAATLGDVWMARLGSGPSFSPVTFNGGYTPQTVVAATWSFRDHLLWILDEHVASGQTMVRLARIDPYLGSAEIVGDWQEGGGAGCSAQHAKNRWLVVDIDGQMLVVTSDPLAQQYSIARLEVVAFDSSAPVNVTRVVTGSGALAFAPLVDQVGYTVVTLGSGGLVVNRSKALQGPPATLADVGATLGSCSANASASPVCIDMQTGVYGIISDTEIASNIDGAHNPDNIPGDGNFSTGLAEIAGTVGAGHRKALISWDLGSLPPNLGIVSAVATLNAHSDSLGGAGSQLSVYGITSSWNASTVTWNTAPTYSTTVIAFDSGGPGVHTFDLTTLAQGWGSASNNGILLDQSGAYYTSLYTSRDPTVTYRPSLHVCYTPAQ